MTYPLSKTWLYKKTLVYFLNYNMDISQTLFLMHIMDGYSFRNMVAIIKSETEYATMVLSEKLIEISFINSSKCAVHKIIFHPQEFIMYRYNIKDQDGNLIKEYPITFETNELFNTTKGIGRRDGIRIYWLDGDNKINIQPIKTSTKDPSRIGALFVKILNMENIRYDIGSYHSEPNVKVQAKEFAELCSQASSLKCTSLEIIGQKNSVIFKGILANQTVASLNKFVSHLNSSYTEQKNQDVQENKKLDTINNSMSLNIIRNEDLITIKVPIATIKAFSKIHNISPTGTLLKFYFCEGKPIKIESPIGTYGTYIVCLRTLKT